MNGFHNWFVIENNFGKSFSFENETISNIIITPFSGQIKIDFLISGIVLNPPKKWGDYKNVYLSIEFFFVNETHTTIKSNAGSEIMPFVIKRFQLDVIEDNVFHIRIENALKDRIEFQYKIARIQNIKPITNE